MAIRTLSNLAAEVNREIHHLGLRAEVHPLGISGGKALTVEFQVRGRKRLLAGGLIGPNATWHTLSADGEYMTVIRGSGHTDKRGGAPASIRRDLEDQLAGRSRRRTGRSRTQDDGKAPPGMFRALQRAAGEMGLVIEWSPNDGSGQGAYYTHFRGEGRHPLMTWAGRWPKVYFDLRKGKYPSVSGYGERGFR